MNSTSKWKKYLFKWKQSPLTQHTHYDCGENMNRPLHQGFRWGPDADSFVSTQGWGWRGAWPQAEVNAASTLTSTNQRTIRHIHTRRQIFQTYFYMYNFLHWLSLYIYIAIRKWQNIYSRWQKSKKIKAELE